MPTHTSLEIYNRLCAGERLRVECNTVQRYQILRQQLARYHRVTRDITELSTDALCSSFHEGIGTFHIGLPKAKEQLHLSISLESVQDAQV